MTVKIYDKLMDLMGREAKLLVGSRFPSILGSKRVLGEIENRVREA